MSEKLDQVALVLCHYPTGPSDVNSCCPEPMGEKRCQVKARLAIAAMRNPTKAMDDAGDALRGDIMEYGPDHMRTYQVMIDEALK
jgi:hypothetical protein